MLSDSDPTAQIHRKEASFHDDWAASVKLEDINVHALFESPTAPENRLILRKMGDLHGKRVLDIGAGLGESSVYFALRGANVTATDISPQMVETACRLARLHGTEIDGLVIAGELLKVPGNSYDFVYAANTIHHVTDKDALFAGIHKALKPGGWFLSWDPLAYNPAINLYRRIATKVRTEDESPLTFADLDIPRRHFVNVGHREFWIAALSLFAKYYFIDQIHPNADRYWKRIFQETPAGLWWWQPLRGLDAVLTRLPVLRRLAWNMVMWGQKSRQ